jgi:hypothetical protein
MTQTLPIEGTFKTFRQLETQFNLQRSTDDKFFPGWLNLDNHLTEPEQQILNRIPQKYFYQLCEGQLGEETIKLIVLSPLLDLAGFFESPFRFTTEPTVQITAERDEIIDRGRIDALVLWERLGVVVIESKETSFSLEMALPQYELSSVFSLLPRRNQLYEVLQILKRLGRLATQ